jgi:hypothetical protein
MARTGTGAEALAKHILKVAPKSAKVIFENDVVRVPNFVKWTPDVGAMNS